MSLIKKIARRLYHSFSRKPKEKIVEDISISKKFISKFLPKNPTIIDCGAHIGIDSMQLSEIPGSKIYSFEPLPDLYNKLIGNTKHLPNVHCYKLALSNYDGEADFYVSSGDSDASSSLLKPKDHITEHPTVHFNEKVKVDCLTLDSWAEKNGITKIDMLWLDMQGFEQAMLEASATILPRVSVIHTEVSLKETYEGVKNYKDFKHFLENKGFKMVLEAIPDGYDMGNVLFVRK